MADPTQADHERARAYVTVEFAEQGGKGHVTLNLFGEICMHGTREGIAPIAEKYVAKLATALAEQRENHDDCAGWRLLHGVKLSLCECEAKGVECLFCFTLAVVAVEAADAAHASRDPEVGGTA